MPSRLVLQSIPTVVAGPSRPPLTGTELFVYQCNDFSPGPLVDDVSGNNLAEAGTPSAYRQPVLWGYGVYPGPLGSVQSGWQGNSSTPTPSTISKFTLSVWYQPVAVAGAGTEGIILEKLNDNNNHIAAGFRYYGDMIYGACYTNAGTPVDMSAGTALVQDVPVFLALTYDGVDDQKVRLYLNGVEVNNATVVGGIEANSTKNWTLGTRTTLPAGTANGIIWEARLNSDVLSAGTLLSQYQIGTGT